MNDGPTPKTLPRFVANFIKVAYSLLGMLIIVFAVLVTIARLATPYVNKDRAKIEAYLSDEIGKPVHIGSVDMWWDAFGPSVKLQDLTVDRHLKIQSLDIDVNLFDSIYQRKLIIKNILIRGGSYTIVQLPNHSWMVNGVVFAPAADHQKTNLADELSIFSDIAVGNVYLDYTDLQQKRVRADIIHMHLNTFNQRYSLSGAVSLLEPYRIPFRFNVTLSGDFTDLDKIQATLYLTASNVLLSEVFPQQVVYGQHIDSGFGDAEIWIDWSHRQVQRLQSQWSISDLRLSEETNTVLLPQFSGNLAWQREQAGWLLSADHILLNVNHHNWPADSFYLEKQSQSTKLGLDYLSLPDLQSMLSHLSLLSKVQLQQIAAFHLKGELSHLILQQEGQGWSLGHVNISANFHDVSMTQQSLISVLPAVAHLSGSLYWQQDHGNVFVNAHQLRYDDPHFFRAPLVFNQAYADLKLQQLNADHWSIGVNNLYLRNPDLTGLFQASLYLDLEGQASSLELLSALRVDHLEHLSRYLPIRVMDPKAADWFGQSFQGGTLDAATLFRGRFADFPFQHLTGTLLSNMTAHQLKLSYNEQWPPLFSKAVTATMVNDILTIKAPEAFSRKVGVTNIWAQIPAVTRPDPRLQLSLVGADQLEDMLDLIDHSVLSDSLGETLNGFQPTGQGTLSLRLNIPLDHSDDTQVAGQLAVEHGNTTILDIPRLAQQINGEIDFTGSSLSVQHATALILNQPALITAETLHTNGGLDILNTHLHTVLSAASLETLSQLPITQFASGTVPLDLCVIRVLNAKRAAHGKITLQLQSNLKGLSMNLPGDLAKTEYQERQFNLQFNYYQQHFLNIKMAYGNLASFDLDTIDASDAAHSNAEGFSVTLGLKQFDWALWQAYFSQQQSARQSPSASFLKKASQQYHNKIVNVNLQIDQATFYNQQLKNIAIVLQPANKAWDFHISSDRILGDFIWPLDKRPLAGNFTRVYLTPFEFPKKVAAKEAAFMIDLRKVPPFRLSIDDFSYGGMLQGKLLLDVSRLPTGLAFNNAAFISSLMTVKVNGQWLQQSKGDATHLAGDISSSNLSEFVNKLKVDSLSDVNISTANANFDLSWPEAPYKPILQKMVGQLSLKLGSGNIANIGKSAETQLDLGRMLNALSVQSLMQKLTLNFNDYKEGYNFTSVEGQFMLNRGDLYTKHTQFNGTVASVGVSGHINVVQHTVNIVLSVKPQVTGSVPVVAGLLINPAVGVAAWFANLVFSPAVSQATAQEFTMTGSWSDPKIVSLAPANDKKP